MHFFSHNFFWFPFPQPHPPHYPIHPNPHLLTIGNPYNWDSHRAWFSKFIVKQLSSTKNHISLQRFFQTPPLSHQQLLHVSPGRNCRTQSASVRCPTSVGKLCLCYPLFCSLLFRVNGVASNSLLDEGISLWIAKGLCVLICPIAAVAGHT